MIREGRRALVFSAHAADFCSRAGGAIRLLVEAGGEVLVYNMSYGENCESPALWARKPPPSVDEIKEIRRAEIAAAAAHLGAEARCFDFGDCPLVIGPQRRLEVLRVLRQFKPDLVLTHWIDDLLHPDHVETTQAVLWACRYCGAPGALPDCPVCPGPELVCYETTLGSAPRARFLPEFFVDVTAVMPRKLAALAEFAAQPALPKGYEILGRYRALEAAMCANLPCEFAEGFTRLVG
jgi:4-oxalomesaconate hydratase